MQACKCSARQAGTQERRQAGTQSYKHTADLQPHKHAGTDRYMHLPASGARVEFVIVKEQGPRILHLQREREREREIYMSTYVHAGMYTNARIAECSRGRRQCGTC